MAHALDFAQESAGVEEPESYVGEKKWSKRLWLIPKAAAWAVILTGLRFVLMMILFFVRGETLGTGR